MSCSTRNTKSESSQSAKESNVKESSSSRSK